MEAQFGFRLPVREAVDQDLATIDKLAAPDGRLLLVFRDGAPVGIGCLRRIGLDTAEIKRMFVQQSPRRSGLGRALLDALVAAARDAGYVRVRLDSPNFMTAAHAMYRSSGFTDIGPYAESEIPDRYKARWVFMERTLSPTCAAPRASSSIRRERAVAPAARASIDRAAARVEERSRSSPSRSSAYEAADLEARRSERLSSRISPLDWGRCLGDRSEGGRIADDGLSAGRRGATHAGATSVGPTPARTRGRAATAEGP